MQKANVAIPSPGAGGWGFAWEELQKEAGSPKQHPKMDFYMKNASVRHACLPLTWILNLYGTLLHSGMCLQMWPG